MNNDSLLQRASSLAENGDYDLARKFVIQALNNNPLDVEAWWAMAHIAKSDGERNHALKKVLEIEPNHAHALHMLDQIRAGSVPSLGGKRASTAKPDDIDFMAKAVITLVAYFVTYFVGIGLNIYFLHDANQFQKKYGIKGENVGCLWAMLALGVGFPVAIFMFVFGMAMIGAWMSI